MRCGSCHRWLHALCGSPAALTASEYPADQHWTCPCCGADNTVGNLNLSPEALGMLSWWCKAASDLPASQG